MPNPIIVLSLLLLMAVTALALADGDQRGQSIMFKNQGDPDYEHLTTMPPKQSRDDRCAEMAREIERLKGKPQRRAVMATRYRQECQMR